MTTEQQQQITQIAKEFAAPFKDTVGEIAGSGWLIVDPLSGYLNSIGYHNIPHQLPATKQHPQVLLLEFADGSHLIPAGSDLQKVAEGAHDWMWLPAA